MAVMNQMRENMKTILMVLVVAFILTIVFSWGMGGLEPSGPKQGIIGVVNGREIKDTDFNEILNAELDRHRERTGNEAEGAQRTQIEDNVWNQLVQEILLEQSIKKLKIKTHDEEILHYLQNEPPAFIKQYPAFQDSAGNFNIQAYQAALGNPEAEQFWVFVENHMRTYLPRQKLQQYLENSVDVNDLEIRKEFEKRNLKATADYLLFDPQKFRDQNIEITDEQIQAYYNDNRDEFDEPEKRKIKYVFFEVKPTANDSATTNNFVKEIIERLQEGEDIAPIAEAYSEDKGSASKGGDLGYFGRGAMVAPFEEAAFSANIGDIVGPVQTQFGIHIIKVTDRKMEQSEEKDGKPEEKVRASHILLKYAPSRDTRQFVSEEAEYLTKQAQELGLDEAAATEKKQVQTSGFFEKESTIPGIGENRYVSYFIFHNKAGKGAGPIYTERGYFVIEINEIQQKRIQPLENVKKQIENNLALEKRRELAFKEAMLFYEKIPAAKSLQEVAIEDSLEVQTAQDVTFGGFIRSIGRDPNLIGAMFALEIGQISKPIKGNQGIYIAQVTARDTFDVKSYEIQKESIKNQLIQRKKQTIFGLWFKALQDQAKIEDYRGLYM